MSFLKRYRATGASTLFLFLLSGAATPAEAQRSRLDGPIQSEQRVTMRGQVPGRIRNANDEGPAGANLVLPDIQLVLRSSDEQQAALDKLLAEQQDSASPNYHKWITPDEYAQRFGASQEDIARITDWLRQQNLDVVGVARGRNSIQVRGTAPAVNQAFRTQIRRYRVDGEGHFANSTEPAIPADLSVMVAAIHGLDDFRLEPRGVQARMTVPEPHYTSGSGTRYLAPGDFATIYNVRPLFSAGLDGSGQTIVVAGQTAMDLADVRRFRERFGLPASDPQIILVPGFQDPGVRSSDVPEANLDLQWAGALAPNARILYVYSSNVLAAVQYAIQQNLAPVISVSYGLCERLTSTSSLTMFQTWARQGNAQGITWLNSSGDSGGTDCYNGTSGIVALAVDTPASVPEVTAIGGTTLASGSAYWSPVNGVYGDSALSYIPETVWNDSTSSRPSASGGGNSTFFLKPFWQTGTGVPNNGVRNVPDFSLAASPVSDAYLVYNGGVLVAYGGTSAGPPAFAGVLALLNQYLTKNAQGAPGVGNINSRLYSLAQTTPSVFHDITVGNNIVNVVCTIGQQNCTSGSYGFNAGTGYDLATGLGSIDMYNLVTSWNNSSGPLLRVPAPMSISSTLDRRSPMRSRQTETSNISSASAVTLIAAISAEAGAVPTGDVVFKMNGATLGTVALQSDANGASAALTVPGYDLAPGANAIVAEFKGDAIYRASTASTVVNLTPQGAPTTITNLANAASFEQTFAPGMLMTVFGTNLAQSTWVAPSGPLPQQMSGVKVTINGHAAPLLYLSPTQINLQIPYEVEAGAETSLVVSNNGSVATATFTLSAAAPGIFVDQNFAPAPGVRGSAGDIATLYITGAQPEQDLGVTVGGIPASIASTSVPSSLVGVVQINYRIPEGVAPGKTPVVVYAGTVSSTPAMLEIVQ